MQQKAPLPIDPLLPEIADCLERNMLTLLEAEPGAGKTTRVPPALLRAGRKPIYVLEPRRLAARMAAQRVASELGENVGATVGYQVRFAEASSSATQIFFVTEGILTRKLLGRAEFPRGSVFILDEFHERHLETDLALALLRDFQTKRPDIRLLIMSATLNAAKLSTQLGNPPLIQAPGKVFPVEIRYTPHSARPLDEQVAAAVSTAISQTKGHILVFLPGAAEIRKAIAACEPTARISGAKLLPLYGDLNPEEQDLAVSPSSFRKIVCSTNVAESSLTIEGVAAVIDSGLARVAAHSPWSGLSELRVEKISRASAIQRAGRAGRTGPGLAIRLYPESDFVRRPEQSSPEIVRADLTQLALQLASYGIKPEQLFWLDPPPAANLDHARDLLERLGALDTPLGRKMGKLPVHPRLSRFVLAATEFGARTEACEFAARLAEGEGYNARRLEKQLLDLTPAVKISKPDPHGLEKALLLGYPDRVLKNRDGGFIVALEVEDRKERSSPIIRASSPIEPEWLLDFFPGRVQTCEELVWNREAERVEQLNSLRYDGLAIDESRGPATDSNAVSALLAEKAAEAGLHRFLDVDQLNRLLLRVKFAAEHDSRIELPEVSLTELCQGLTGFSELRSLTKDGGFIAYLESKLPMRLIDEIAPAHIVLPSGRRAKIEYHEGRPPSVSSRLQDFFGMRESPSVAKGKVPLVVHLLAPNQRPLQVTTDLAGFWNNLYPQVKRELSRRYPKHSWP